MKAYALTIVALGDSTTAGTPYYRSPAEAPPNGLGNAKAPYTYTLAHTHPEWVVYNRGIAGQRTDEIRNRFSKDVLALHPDIVIILAGVNDIYQERSITEAENNLEWMYLEARKHRITPIAASVLPYNTGGPQSAASIRALNDWIRINAQQLQIPFCDLHTVVADPQNPDLLKTSPEGIHPDLAGYQAMGKALIPVINASRAALKNVIQSAQ